MSGQSVGGSNSIPIQTQWRLQPENQAAQSRQAESAAPTSAPSATAPTAPAQAGSYGIDLPPQPQGPGFNLENRNDFNRVESYEFDQQVRFQDREDSRFEKPMLGEELREWGEGVVDRHPLAVGAVGLGILATEGGKVELDRSVNVFGRDAEIGLRIEHDPNDNRMNPITREQESFGSNTTVGLSFTIRR